MAPTLPPPHDPGDPETWAERRQSDDVARALDEVRRLNNSVVTLAASVQQSAEREMLAQRRFQLLMVVALVAVAFIATWTRLSDIWAANRIVSTLEDRVIKRIDTSHDLIICLVRPDGLPSADRLTACRLESEAKSEN